MSNENNYFRKQTKEMQTAILALLKGEYDHREIRILNDGGNWVDARKGWKITKRTRARKVFLRDQGPNGRSFRIYLLHEALIEEGLL